MCFPLLYNQGACTSSNGFFWCDVDTTGDVTVYGNSAGFEDAVCDDIKNHSFDIDGLVGVSSCSVTEAEDDGALAEGAGLVSATSNQKPRGNISPDDGKITAAAGVGIAIAATAILLCALFTVRHRRRGPMGADELKPIQTSDDDDANTEASPGRLVYVLGEDDSLVAGRGFDGEDKPVLSSPRMSDVPSDTVGHVHLCASATCEACEKRRQSGVQFVQSNTVLPPGVPADASREYVADDTVVL